MLCWCLVALSYSVQILDDGVIPITPNDVYIDALVSPAGVIPITSAALHRYTTLHTTSHINISGLLLCEVLRHWFIEYHRLEFGLWGFKTRFVSISAYACCPWVSEEELWLSGLKTENFLENSITWKTLVAGDWCGRTSEWRATFWATLHYFTVTVIVNSVPRASLAACSTFYLWSLITKWSSEW